MSACGGGRGLRDNYWHTLFTTAGLSVCLQQQRLQHLSLLLCPSVSAAFLAVNHKRPSDLKKGILTDVAFLVFFLHHKRQPSANLFENVKTRGGQVIATVG